jgi:uncharacterized protein
MNAVPPAARFGYLGAMQLVQDFDPGGFTIVAHDVGMVQVNGERLASSCVVAPDRLIRDWSPRTVDELTAEHLVQLVELEPEMVLLGVGARLRFPDRALLRPMEQRGIGVEVMDTPAACRTYNLLMGDGRRVVAALLID